MPTPDFALAPGERLLWSGQPRSGVTLQPSDALLVPFSFLWGGFAFFWEWSVIKDGAPSLFALFGVPFVLVGVYIIIGRFFFDAFRRSRTRYAVTSERILIRTQLWSPSLTALSLRTLPESALSERGDGSGTIVFGPDRLVAKMSFGLPSRVPQSPTFEMIGDVKKVWMIIQEAQRAATASPPAA